MLQTLQQLCRNKILENIYGPVCLTLERWEEQHGDYYVRITPVWKMEREL